MSAMGPLTTRAVWAPFGPSRNPPPSGVQGEPLHQITDLSPDLLLDPLVVGVPQDVSDDRRDLPHLRLVHPERRARGRPDPDPRGGRWWVGVVRDLVLVERDPHLVGQGLRGLAVH